jgi:hypothetical protein
MRYIYQQADKTIVWLTEAAQRRLELIDLLYHAKDFNTTYLRGKIRVSGRCAKIEGRPGACVGPSSFDFA